MATDLASRILDLKRSTTDLLETLAETDAELAADERERAGRAERQRLERIARASERTADNTERLVYRAELSVRERSQFIAAHGQKKYLALPYRRP